MTIDLDAKRIDVGTPLGVSGEWAVEAFSINEQEADHYNAVMDTMGKLLFKVQPGDYKRLMHRERGVVMSNTPMEVATNTEFLRKAYGNVLVNGLGVGMVLEALMANTRVDKVTVVEISEDVIALTAGHFATYIQAGKLVIIRADCLERKPGPNEVYDFVWHDIWDTISDNNLEEMELLKNRFAPIAWWQGCWAEKECEDMKHMFEVMLAKRGRTYEEFQIYCKESAQ